MNTLFSEAPDMIKRAIAQGQVRTAPPPEPAPPRRTRRPKPETPDPRPQIPDLPEIRFHDYGVALTELRNLELLLMKAQCRIGRWFQNFWVGEDHISERAKIMLGLIIKDNKWASELIGRIQTQHQLLNSLWPSPKP